MTKETIRNTFFLLLVLAIAGFVGSHDNKEQQLYAAIGKMESDSGICLTKQEIALVRDSQLTDEYKNYLFEIDQSTYNGSQFCRDIK